MLSTNLKIKHEWLVTHFPSFIRKSTARLAAWSNIFFICIKNPARLVRFSQCMINKWPRVKCSATKKKKNMYGHWLWVFMVPLGKDRVSYDKNNQEQLNITVVTRDGNTDCNDASLTVRMMIWTDRLGYSIVFHYFAMKVLGRLSSCVYHIARFY